jgi:hypothetical protein
MLFRHGEIVKKFPEAKLADVLVAEVENMIREKQSGAGSQDPV